MFLKNSIKQIVFAGAFLFLLCEPMLGGQPNLLLNSDIETGTSTPTYWGTYITSGTMQMTWSTAQQVSGTHSLCSVVTSPGVGDWRQCVSDIDDSINYRFRVHLRASNIATGSHGVELQWFTSDNTYLGREVFSATTADEWQELKDNDIEPPANAAKAYILMRSYAVGTYYFDDPVLTRKDNDTCAIEGKFPFGLYNLPKYELVLNGGSEYSTSNNNEVPKTWTNWTGSGSPTFTWDTSLAYSGGHSLKVSLSADAFVDWRQRIDNIDDSLQYTLSAKVYASNVSLDSHGVELHWFDASSSYLGRDVFYASTANQWESIYQANITPPTGAAKVYFLLRAYKTGNYNFDDLSFVCDKTSQEKIAEIKDAGFNLLVNDYFSEMATEGDIFGVRSVDMSDTTTTQSTVNLYESESALRIWHGNDEPAWINPAIPSLDMTDCYDTIQDEDLYTGSPRPVWLNHAPRGTYQYPTDFDLLRPYSAGADIVSMDIYPVGIDSHSNLSDRSISCVGAYTQILYNQVCSDSTGLQDKVIWMVLQNFNWETLGATPQSVEVHWFNSSDEYISKIKYYSTQVNTWDLISVNNITPPSGAVKAYVLLKTYSNGSFYFDDVVFAENGSNLLSNSNFETQDGSGNWPADWTRHIDFGTTTYSWDTSTFNSSSHSAKSTVSNGNADWRQVVDVDDSKTYSLSAYVKNESSPVSDPTWLQSRFMVYDAIINGARGILYWGTRHITSNSPLWDQVKELAGEVSDLSSELVSPLSFREVTGSSTSVEYLLLDTDSGLLLITANKTNSTISNVTWTISGLPLSQIQKYDAASPESISNNSFTKSYSPYEVKIWYIE